uniref:Uncharacterized protein n=1 Tax=Corethron hystrix TaxID=216773 RepID=A0A7S1FTH4_9STRA|mmetsp:Transcript_26373/g.60769  ORF Transcript_26373/g.60769 Transcript_26373/m.60769 type:complete len:405 (+) Transcript_26373:120-1334(+)
MTPTPASASSSSSCPASSSASSAASPSVSTLHLSPFSYPSSSASPSSSNTVLLSSSFFSHTSVENKSEDNDRKKGDDLCADADEEFQQKPHSYHSRRKHQNRKSLRNRCVRCSADLGLWPLSAALRRSGTVGAEEDFIVVREDDEDDDDDDDENDAGAYDKFTGSARRYHHAGRKMMALHDPMDEELRRIEFCMEFADDDRIHDACVASKDCLDRILSAIEQDTMRLESETEMYLKFVATEDKLTNEKKSDKNETEFSQKVEALQRKIDVETAALKKSYPNTTLPFEIPSSCSDTASHYTLTDLMIQCRSLAYEQESLQRSHARLLDTAEDLRRVRLVPLLLVIDLFDDDVRSWSLPPMINGVRLAHRADPKGHGDDVKVPLSWKEVNAGWCCAARIVTYMAGV